MRNRMASDLSPVTLNVRRQPNNGLKFRGSNVEPEIQYPRILSNMSVR